MFRSIRSLIVVAAAVACLWPVAATAQVQQFPQMAPEVRTVEQARQAFSDAGYTVDQAHTWDWTSPPFATFQVKDSSRDRVLVVLVYPSVGAAQVARLQAASNEQPSAARPSGGDVGPHMVIGYGPSTWSGNVAMVQTTGSQLLQLYQIQIDQSNDFYVNPDL